MKAIVKPEIVEALADLEKEMRSQDRPAVAEALREALTVLTRRSGGWLTTGEAAERLAVSIPTVKDWIRRGTLKGVQRGNRWLVSEESVETILGIRGMFADLEEEGYPTEDEIYEATKRVRRQMIAEKRATLG